MTTLFIQYAILVVKVFTELLFWSIFGWVIFSWIMLLFPRVAARLAPVAITLEQIVRPVLRPFRWARIGMLDFSPIVAILAINFVGDVCVSLLLKLQA